MGYLVYTYTRALNGRRGCNNYLGPHVECRHHCAIYCCNFLFDLLAEFLFHVHPLYIPFCLGGYTRISQPTTCILGEAVNIGTYTFLFYLQFKFELLPWTL